MSKFLAVRLTAVTLLVLAGLAIGSATAEATEQSWTSGLTLEQPTSDSNWVSGASP